MSRQSITRRWVSAIVLTLGIGTVWGAIIGICVMIVGTLMPSRPITTENIVVVIDGTPLIQTQIAGNYYNTELRTLEGQSIELDDESWLGGIYYSEPYRKPSVIQLPISWAERIAGCSDYGKPPASWLLIRDDQRPGSVYFTGFDTTSKLNIGFIGRNGFRATIPPADELFDLGNQTFAWGSNVAATPNGIDYGSSSYHYNEKKPEDDRHLAPWIVFLLDGDVIQEIDLRRHTVRPLKKLDGLFAIEIAWQPAPDEEKVEEEIEKLNDADQQTNHTQSKFRLAAMQNTVFFPVTPAKPINTKQKTTHRLLARCTDRIVAINPFDGSQQEFPLPQELLQEGLTVYSIADDQLLLQVDGGYWEHGSITDLLWINSAGEVNREKTLRLAGYTPGNESLQFIAAAAVAPTLLPWVFVSTIVAPLSMVQDHQVENYVAGLSKALSECWPALLLILVLSIALTLVVRRWQKKYSRDNTTLWCATVFATTVPGLLAYWLMHRGTLIEACPECSQLVPRDRDACARCEKPFAAPALLGTEILT